MAVPFHKPPISVQDMIAQIQARGIIVDVDHAKELFTFKNYYRYLPYIKLETGSTEAPKAVDLRYIERRYRFDKKLRNLLLDSTESIENFARHDITEYFRISGRSFYDFLNPQNAALGTFGPNDLITKVNKTFTESDNEGIVFHKKKHGCVLENIPVWVLVEALEFGTTLWIIETIERDESSNRSRLFYNHLRNKYGIEYSSYHSCLKSTKALRNACAHGCRLYKSSLNAHKPKYPLSWMLTGVHGERLTSQNTKGLYRSLIGLKSFYKYRQESWLEFVVSLYDHFEANKGIVAYEDYHLHTNWVAVLLDGW